MIRLSQTQRQYDRMLPVDFEKKPVGDPMDILRDDLKCDDEARDIAGNLSDLMQETDEDIKMIRALAEGNDAMALVILKTVLRCVSELRAKAAT